jgi:ligand-binding sensor domain-containing protein/class 3 adenylate cyclase
VWIGTEAGLASYDGNVIVNHGTDEGVARSGARSLLLDRDGRLFAGHLDGGVTMLQGNHFQAYTVAGGMGSAITAMLQDQEGAIWLITAGDGALRLDPLPEEGGEVGATRYGTEKGVKEKLLGAVFTTAEGLCVVEDGGGIKRYDKGADAFTEVVIPGVSGVFRLTSVFVDSRGALWVGTVGGGAFRRDAQNAIKRYDIPTGMPSDVVFCFGEDSDGQVWIGTLDAGVAVVTNNGLRTYNKSNGLHDNFIRSINTDREGNLLIGTNEGGLDVFKGDRFVSFGEEDGLTDPQVWAIMEDRQGRTWFGTNDGIVVLKEEKDGRKVETFRSQNGVLTNNFIRCLREDDKGYVWVGTLNGGLLRYDPRTGKAQYDPELSGSLAEQKVTALENGQSGELWVGGINGVRRYLPGSGTVPTIYTANDGLAGDNVVSLFRDDAGTIWVGSTVNGVSVIDNGRAQPLDLGRSFTATCFAQDKEGRIWVGTEGQGLIVLEGRKERSHFTREEGLLSNSIKALGVDKEGNVWIGTTEGLNKWRMKKGGFIAFTERAGFVGIEVKSNAVWTDRQGDIWFGTAKGATRVGAERAMDRTIPPLVAIRGWKVNLEDRAIGEDMDLSHTERNVRIEYGSVSLSDPGAVRYQYMLQGLDAEWQPITDETDAYYPALPPARYTFKIKAMDRSGEWSAPTELAFTILPPWYRSWWFYTAMALFIGIVLFSYIKVRERQLTMRNLVLERKVKERTEEVVAQSQEIEGQKVRIEDLLLNILPKQISEELKDKGKATARRHEAVTVMFTDMKGFTKAAEKMTPEQLVNELDHCFIGFDEIIGRYGIEKIKTIGDAYMCAGGVPMEDPHHANKAVLAAMEVRSLMEAWRVEREAKGQEPWILRIGAHSGPVVAGVVGKRKFAYDIWGDTVNTASRMESSGVPGEVNVSGATYELIKDRFECEHRGKVEAKNKGQIDMYFVRRIKPAYSADPEGRRPNAKFMAEIGVSEALHQLA